MTSSINPIILFVKEFDASLEFYEKKLGLRRISGEEPEEEFARFDVGGVVFALHGGYEGEVEEGNIALHFAVVDIRSEVKRLKAKGVKFSRRMRKMPWGAYQTSFVDPDGNEIDMIQHPTGGPVM
jgi:predicted enzyme related to lactoylglutathione lyase